MSHCWSHIFFPRFHGDYFTNLPPNKMVLTLVCYLCGSSVAVLSTFTTSADGEELGQEIFLHR